MEPLSAAFSSSHRELLIVTVSHENDEMFALMRRDKNTTLEIYYSAFTKHHHIVITGD